MPTRPQTIHWSIYVREEKLKIRIPRDRKVHAKRAVRLREFVRVRVQGELGRPNHVREDAQGAQYRTGTSYDHSFRGSLLADCALVVA